MPEAELEARARGIAATLANGPTATFGACKRLILQGGSQSFETLLEDEAVALVRSFTTRDADEGFRAFLEKRAPRFRGVRQAIRRW